MERANEIHAIETLMVTDELFRCMCVGNVCMYVRIYMYVSVCVCVYVCMYVCMHR